MHVEPTNVSQEHLTHILRSRVRICIINDDDYNDNNNDDDNEGKVPFLELPKEFHGSREASERQQEHRNEGLICGVREAASERERERQRQR